MTPRIARKQMSRGGQLRRNAQKRALKKYLKKLLGGGRVLSQSTEAGSSSSWICISTSWTDIKMCTGEFGSSTILGEDFGNDDFLGECMELYRSWTWTWRWCCEVMEKETTELSEMASLPLATPSLSAIEDICCPCCCDCEGLYLYLNDEALEESMKLFSEWTATEEEGNVEEAVVEPEMHNNHLVVALPSSMLPSPSGADFLRLFSCSDLLLSMAVLLFETRHLQYINQRLALPPPPKMLALEAPREMDPPNSVASTVSLPSGWDAVSARLSTSSIFNLFSDRVATPIPSLFSIDPTGVPSTASTVSVPLSFWDTSSTVSVTGPAPTSAISIPSTFFNPRPLPSSTSSLFIDPSEVSSSISTLFMDPSSAHSTLSLDSSGCTSSSSLLTESLSSASLSSDSCSCIHCQSDSEDQSTESEDYSTDFDVDSTDDETECVSYNIGTVSSASSGYDTYVDSEPVVLKKMTTTESTQTDESSQSSPARMLAECDEMLEKLVEMKKRLREML